MSDAFRLDGRTVVVTGASRGIGAAVARRGSELGAGLVLVARNQGAIEALAGELDTPVATVAGDVADPETAERAVAAAEALPGRLWGLVNNAGVSAPGYRPVVDTPLSDWDETFRTNVIGAVAFARAVGARLAEGGQGGRIVNLGSIAGLTGLPAIAPYNATKAAIDSLTRSLAVELGPRGVLCNSINPGTITTEMVDGLMQANPALKDRLVAKSPLGRLGAPDEAAWPILFLLTDAASFITGETLLVDGGRLAAG